MSRREAAAVELGRQSQRQALEAVVSLQEPQVQDKDRPVDGRNADVEQQTERTRVTELAAVREIGAARARAEVAIVMARRMRTRTARARAEVAVVMARRPEEEEHREEVEEAEGALRAVLEVATRAMTAEGDDHDGEGLIQEELEAAMEAAAAVEEDPMPAQGWSLKVAKTRRRKKVFGTSTGGSRMSATSGEDAWRPWRPCGRTLRVAAQQAVAVAVGRAPTRGARTSG